MLAFSASSALGFTGAVAQTPSLFDLTIEELGQVRVTTAARTPQALIDTPASVYVITAEDIRRSGVTSIPEALRLAPGVEVARNSSSSWTISIRGFSSDLSNKLLVLIDGRSVYSPLFAGVFWDVQDTLLEDIDRIEVVAGPGGTLWGANAVNGVINIITKSSAETQGGYAELGTGEEETFAGFRYGGTLGTDATARAYLKYFDRDGSRPAAGGDGIDEWDMARGGFRIDSGLGSSDRLTIQGDLYAGDEGAELRGPFTLGTLPEFFVGDVEVAGQNLLGAWQRDLAAGAGMRLQAYYDRTERRIPGTFNEKRSTFDVDFQMSLAPRGRHELLWGAALRSTSDSLDNTLFATFEPRNRDDQTISGFLQDRIGLLENRVHLTVGSKVEHNDYTGTEYQPNVRIAWTPDERRALWAAVSRAVRIPARLNTDLQLTAPFAVPGIDVPFYVNVNGSDAFEAEKLDAYEIGYRMQVGERLSFDVAAFRNRYDDLQTMEAQEPMLVEGPPTYVLLPAVQANGMEGDATGGTLAANWQPRPAWRLKFQYARLDLELRPKVGSNDLNSPNQAGNSPEYQLSLYSFIDFSTALSLFTGIRYVDDLPNQGIDSYTAVDLNLLWQISPTMRASLTAQNATDAHHAEFGEGNEIERSVLAKLTWSF
jgi:iron complex outermembrane receptor protein